MDLPKVVSSDQETLIVTPADSVDVSAVWPIGPQAWGGERRGREISIKKHTPEGREKEGGAVTGREREQGTAFTYQTPGSPECRCRWPTQYLWWSPHWPPVYTLMGSLKCAHKQTKWSYMKIMGTVIIIAMFFSFEAKSARRDHTHSSVSHSPLN